MTLQDGMRIIDAEVNGQPILFDVKFLKADRKKKTGGEFAELKQVVKTGLPYSLKDKFMIGVKIPDAGGKPTAIHCRLITHINGIIITY